MAPMPRETKVSGERMARFWDRRAQEDAFYFVDNTRGYRGGDPDSFWAQGERQLDAILAAVGASVAPQDIVVDIGCGVGRLTRVLAGRARHVHGLDVSAEMIARARELNGHLDNVSWHVGDGTSLRPLEDASADAVVSHVVFQHIPDPRITLGYVAEMGRVLRPGGWAAFQVSNDPGVHNGRHRPPGRMQVLLGRAPRGQRDPRWLGSAVDLGDLRATAAAAGATVQAVVGEGTQFCFVRLVRD